MNDATLAEQVRHYRVAARLTQAELAERARVSERAISDIERGLRGRVYPVTARALADALGLTDEARTTLERAAQSGRKVRDRDETSVAWRFPVTGEVEKLPGADQWRAMRRTPMIGRDDEFAFLLRSLGDDGPRMHSISGPVGSASHGSRPRFAQSGSATP